MPGRRGRSQCLSAQWSGSQPTYTKYAQMVFKPTQCRTMGLTAVDKCLLWGVEVLVWEAAKEQLS